MPRDELETAIRSVVFKRKAISFHQVDGNQVVIVAMLYRGRDSVTHFRASS